MRRRGGGAGDSHGDRVPGDHSRPRNKAKEGTTVPEVRPYSTGPPAIDDIKSVSGKDLEVTKDGDKVVVSFAYDTRNPHVRPGLPAAEVPGPIDR